MERIYLSPPDVGELEREMLLRAFDSNWIAPLGPEVDAFEQEVAARAGLSQGAALSSGTAALHLALILSGVGPGDEVLVASQTFAASANAVVYTGATPVFIDSHPDTWTLDPELLQEALEDGARRGRVPKAVIVVDLYGQCADYDAIRAVCEPYDVVVIEDAAEALGATYKDRPAGSLGDFGVFSFNGNKIMTTSGGGMLVAHRADQIARARFLASQAREPVPYYQHETVGFNYRLSNLLAALGRAQLSRLDAMIRRRKQICGTYQAAFREVPGVRPMPHASYGETNAWLAVVQIDPEVLGVDREQIRLHLEANAIECRPTWKPMHLQPVFSGNRTYGGRVSEEAFERGLCLPTGSSLTSAQQSRVIEVFLEVATGNLLSAV